MRKKLILAGLLLLLIQHDGYSQPTCIMVPAYDSGPNAPLSGSGYYYDPYVFHGKTVKLKCVVTGEDLDHYYYQPQIHMDGRNCSLIQGQWLLNQTCTVQQINNVIFEFTAQMPGRFYLRVDWKFAGDTTWNMIDYNQWRRIIIKFPPIDDNLYFEPYSLPQDNDKPVATIVSLNDIGGDGSWSNPWRIHPDTTYYKFRIDIYDADGEQDLIDGCYVWAWHFIPGGSMYNTTTGDFGKGVKTEAQTYIYYNDIKNVVFPVDMPYTLTRGDSSWTLTAQIYDRWGESSSFENWQTDVKYMVLSTVPGDTSSPDPPELAVLSVNVDTLSFTATDTVQQYAVINIGGGTLTWQSTATIPWFCPNKGSGSLEASQADTVTALAIADSVDYEDFYSGYVTFSSNGGSKMMTVLFDYNIPPSPPTNLQVTEQ